jgi:Phasin protein
MPKNPQTTQRDLLTQAIPLMANSDKFVLTIARLQGQAFMAMMRYPIEALGFLRHRYEQDVKLVDDLIATKDVNDALDIYAGFCEKAVAEYSTQASKIATMSSELASEAGKRMQKEADIITKDVTAVSEKIVEVAAA